MNDPSMYRGVTNIDPFSASHPYRILLILTDLNDAGELLPMVDAIAEAEKGKISILHIVPASTDVPLNETATQASIFREKLNSFLPKHVSISVDLKSKVWIPSEIWQGIWETAQEDQVDLVLMSWNTVVHMNMTNSLWSDPLFVLPPCDLVIVRPSQALDRAGGWYEAERILVPLRGGKPSALTFRIGHTLAQRSDASITLLHITSKDKQEEQSLFHDEFEPVIHQLDRITRSVITKGPLVSSIVEEAGEHQVIVMGGPAQSKDSYDDSYESSYEEPDPMFEEILRCTEACLVIVKERVRPLSLPGDLDEPTMIKVNRPVAVVVNHWFAENTFHSREFANLERLIMRKETQGVTISLGLPALNEEETVGNVIQTIKTSLMDEFPLLDEMVLIDSGSKDQTRQIAADLGIPVFIHHEILPQYGSFHGKGEALWKSLYVLHGDIVAWIDTDIRNIHPHFVYGILGPLLSNPDIQYVKGFYRRPLRDGHLLVAGGGGRVTELTARPFINLLFPELSGLIQPLSGEYAGRRASIEQLPFFTGYGVETGLLIDYLERYGLDAIAQVDLLERIHHNQPLPSLSKMSFAIMQVVFSRLDRRHQLSLLGERNRTMNLIRYGQRRRYYLETAEILEQERTPMITIPEYRQKRGLEINQLQGEQTET